MEPPEREEEFSDELLTGVLRAIAHHTRERAQIFGKFIKEYLAQCNIEQLELHLHLEGQLIIFVPIDQSLVELGKELNHPYFFFRRYSSLVRCHIVDSIVDNGFKMWNNLIFEADTSNPTEIDGISIVESQNFQGLIEGQIYFINGLLSYPELSDQIERDTERLIRFSPYYEDETP